MLSFVTSTLAAAFSFLALTAAVDNITEPLSTFLTRPDLYPPALNCSIQHSGVTPGYMFIAPYQGLQAGPYIYDKACNLVWSGFGNAGPGTVHDVRVCKYNGADHLCFFQGKQLQGYARGHGIIMDSSYSVVKTVEVGGSGIPAVDMHEFNVINDGKSALVTAFQTLPYDLSAYKITTGVGYVMQGTFQEIDIATGEVLFEWQSIDHVPLKAAYILPNTTDTSGTGLTSDTPWNYFHINSIDKSSYSHTYLISARSVSSIYSLNTTDGSIIWTLSAGGPFTDFACTNFNFSFQHDARLVSENTTHTVISFIDNATNGFNHTSKESSGLIVSIDHTAKTATLIKRIVAPPKRGIHSTSQGNVQRLDNGGYFMGWGDIDAVSEHAADGTPLLFATLAPTPS